MASRNINAEKIQGNLGITSVTATTISGATYYSGGTELSTLFAAAGSNTDDITRVVGGTNISTGGTANNPSVNLDDDITLNSVSAAVMSATTLSSQTINTATIKGFFNPSVGGNDLITISDSVYMGAFANFSGGTNGGVIYSAGTPLHDIFVTSADGNGIYDGSGTVPTTTAVAITDTINFDSDTFVIDGSADSIGIGTPSPAYKLEVSGTTNISGPIYSAGTELSTLFAAAGSGVPDVIVDTGSTINFSAKTIYDSPSTPSTGNYLDNLTGAKIGIVQKSYHNSGSAPTFPAGWVLLGDGIYFTSQLNIIYAEWVSGTRVEYWIIQEQ